MSATASKVRLFARAQSRPFELRACAGVACAVTEAPAAEADGPAVESSQQPPARHRASHLREALIGLGAITLVLIGITLLAYRGSQARTLRADVLSVRRAEPGENVAITISARDNFGAVANVAVDFGDGHVASPIVADAATACRSEFARTERFGFKHTYERSGVFTVRSVVSSEGCGATPEQRTATLTVEVGALKR